VDKHEIQGLIPDGVGIAVRKDGVLLEGGFKCGELASYRIVEKNR